MVLGNIHRDNNSGAVVVPRALSAPKSKGCALHSLFLSTLVRFTYIVRTIVDAIITT